MEAGLTENLLPTNVIPPPAPSRVGKVMTKDPPDIIEIKKSVSFLEAQRLSTFNEKFSRSSQLTFHNSSVNSLSLSADCQYLASCSSDLNIYVWMVDSKQLVGKFFGHKAKVNSVSFCDNASFLASGSDDKTVKVWNIRMRKEELVFTGHTFNVLSVAFSPDGKIVISASSDKSIILWNLQKKAQEHKFTYGSQTMCLSFTSDSRYFAAGGLDNQIKVHNVFGKRWELGLDGHTQAVLSVAYSSTQQYIVSGSMDQLIKIWDAKSGKEEFTLKGHTEEVFSVSFSKDVNFIISGSKDKTIRIWDLSTHTEIHQFNFHTDTITCVLFTKTHKTFVSASSDSLIQYWDLNDKDHTKVLTGHKRQISSFDITTDEKYLISTSGSIFYNQRGEIIIWNTENFTEEAKLEDPDGGISVARLSKDNKTIATGNSTGKIRLWDFSKREETKILEGHSGDVNSISFSPDAKWMISASGSINFKRKGELLLWNWESLALEAKIEVGHSGWVSCVNFFHDSVHVAAAVGCSVVVWNIIAKTVYCSVDNFPSWIQCLIVSPDGKYIVSGDRDQNIRVWNFTEKRLEHSFIGHKFGISSLGFSPDSQFLLSGSFDKTICVWNFKEKLQELKFEKHEKSVSALFYPPSMKYFFSGSEDEKIIVWNNNTLTPCTQLFSYPLQNWNVKFTESYETILQNKANPSEVKIFNPKEGKETSGTVGLTLPDTNFDPFSLFDEKYYEFFTYHNAIYCISYERYHLMDPKAWKMVIGNNGYTPLHFAAFKGKTKVVTDLTTSKTLYFRSDNLGRSPLYYSILAKHQAITDLFLDYLINTQESSPFEVYYPLFYSVRNDLSVIIINSSPSLCDFLGKFLYSKDEPPYFGVALNRVKFITSVNTSFSDFVNEETDNSEPLRFKTSLFELPSNIGSDSSKELLMSFLKCSNKDLYKVPIVRNFIRSRWESIRGWTYSYTALLWINLIFLGVLVDNSKACDSPNGCDQDKSTWFFISFILFIVVNVLLFVWELFQLFNSGFAYFTEFWNLLDVVRVILTTTWLVLQNFLEGSDALRYIEWFVVFINLARGVTGFRAFDTTRYYVGLIMTSILTIKSFLLIFVYTILAFGLLSVAAHQSSANFNSLWSSSFILAMADFSVVDSDQFDIRYLTYLFAIIINVVLMLNMIISILGDSFDEFQLFSVYYDNREMTQVILEIEEIFSVFRKFEESKYLHICVNAYETESNNWQGKVLDVRNFIKENIDLLSTKVDQVTSNLESTKGSLQTNLTQISDSVKSSETQSQKRIDSISEKIKQLENSLSDINSSLSSKIESLDGSMITLTSKLDSILILLTK